jgi:HAD superfamily hydrolase (TIGR01509 family)
VRAVLFDYGRTLVDFDYPRQGLIDTLEHARRWLGPTPPSAEALLDQIMVPIESALEASNGRLDEIDYVDLHDQIWRDAGFNLSRPALMEIIDFEQRSWAAAARPDPDAFPTLDELRRRGIRIGICSNAPFPPAMMRRQMQGLGIAERVDTIVLSVDIGRRKPDPAIYRAALEQVGAAAQETLFVGDRVREDYEGPRQLGMQALLYQPLATSTGQPTTDVINRLDDVLQFVR